MCGIEKCGIALLLCACLCLCAGCGSGEAERTAMLLEDGLELRETAYVTEETAVGSLYLERECSTSIGYWKEAQVTCADVAGAALTELFVAKGQEVKAGDVLAVFDVPYSPAELDALFAEREIAWLRYQSGLGSYTSALQQARAALAALVPGTTEYAVAQQEVIRAQSAYDYYVSSQNASISAIDERILELQEKLETTAVLAPMDGVVRTVDGSLKVGDVVSAGTLLCTIVDPSDTYYTVQYSDVFPFRSGTQVVLYSRYYEDGAEFPGRVLSSPADLGGDAGQVILMAEDPEVQKGMTAAGSVSFARLRFELENVLSVPATALQEEDNSLYVLVLEGGLPVRRNVVAGAAWNRPEDGVQAVQIFAGIEPGDLVIVE